ncbi:M24 family metallopeptidase [Alicyclobacillus sp. SO9]|uniref:M24 family metallopeptidase n=1 Tax=Alicyclobacillus sp. SO9 TaxID=2665646 RepID=UPI0018E80EB0|nr:M24 family metallopeptidase [Alicyclobacillus sp. SO9]QQE79031.1 M24 family metallopeptidase [Alicyclobacillus sp. SO9]
MELFHLSEYDARLAKTKQAMENEGLDVLLVTDPANMNYLSGYDGWSFYVSQMLIVAHDEAEPIWVGRKMDAPGANWTTWLSQSSIRAYPDDYVQSDVKHPMDFAADVLRSMGKFHCRIGVEMDAYYFTARSLQRLTAGLPDAVFHDATLLVNRIRIIKSNQEIAYMQRAARIAESAMKTAVESIAEGVRECDVAANIFSAQIRGIEGYGGDYPAIVPLLPAGERSGSCHLTWTDKRYQPGDTVIVELAGCYKRYHSPLARTIQVGDPPVHIRNLTDVVIEGVETALDAVKPGVACEEVETAWRRVIERAGYKKESRLGYSVGLNYPPDWGEHTASLRPGDRTELVPNMTFHMIAGMWMDGYGVEMSETFRVTQTGCETLANFPRELAVKSYAL